ncbi:hypothetical protein C5O23_01895 [Duncaniella muris]|uniref:Uncharacterized protein n=1 Tax=Duncaniella muris TaxID=2094150 RepID=A0A2V1IQT1_9BACT|nr:hypothetical protein C5O23_01895 [Duncaniella muris]
MAGAEGSPVSGGQTKRVRMGRGWQGPEGLRSAGVRQSVSGWAVDDGGPEGLRSAGVRQDTDLIVAPDTAAHCA